METGREEVKINGVWGWFRDKVLPSLFIALTLGVIASGWSTYNSLQSLTPRLERLEINYKELEALKNKIYQFDSQTKELELLKAQIVTVRSEMVSKTELLETLKRVELQLQLLLAQSGVSKKINITGN